MAGGVPVFNLAGTAVISTTTATVSWPTHATNDVALLLVETGNQASALVTAAGFVLVATAIGTGTAGAASAVAIAVYWKRATTTAEANVTCADAGDHVGAQIITFTNVATTGNPWNVTFTGVKAAASTATTVTGAATTTQGNCLIVVCLANGADSATNQVSAWTAAGLANPSIASNAAFNSASGTGGGIQTANGGLLAAGAIPNITATNATAVKNAFIVIALAPDPITGTGNVAAPPIALAGTATQTITGTGTVAVPMSLVLPFAAVRRSILDGITAASSPANGWNNQKANLAVTDVVRTSDTVVTITLDALGSYDITANEVLTVTVPRCAIVTGPQIVATPTVGIDALFTGTGNVDLTFTLSGTGTASTSYSGSGDAALAFALSGSGTQTITGTGTVAVAQTLAGTGIAGAIGTGDAALTFALAGTATQTITGTGAVAITMALAGTGTGLFTHTGTGDAALAFSLAGTGTQVITGTGSVALTFTVSGTSPFAAVRAAIIAGLDSAQAEAAGWDAVVKVGIPVSAVVRTSSTVVTITLPAFASYNITATETITATIPGSALTGAVAIVATPTFDITAQVNAGNATVPSMVLSGTGLVGVIGTGTVALPVPSVAFGDNMVLPALVLSGTGSVITAITATGSVSMTPVPSATGTQGTFVTGTGSVAVAPSLAGTGTQTITGTGSAAVTQTLAGTASQTITGTGTAAVSVSASGSALVGVFGSGTVEIIEALLEGIGTRTAVSTHGPGRYKPEHDSALVDVGAAHGFADEHASALHDILEAGV